MDEFIATFRRLLDLNFFENPTLDCLIFFLVIFFGIIFRKLISKLLSSVLYRIFKKYSPDNTIGKFTALLLRPLELFTLLIFVYIAFSFIKFPSYWHLAPQSEFGIKMILLKGYQILLIYSIIVISLRMVDAVGVIMRHRAAKTETKLDDQIVPFVVDSLKVIAVIFGIFIILGSVFNLNITSLIAGLGIGGLAVALAAKESIENLLGSFTIFLDKPFLVGDLITVGNVTGFVEKIGFRSTRIRTLDKSYLTIPNKKMVDSELENISMRTFRRVIYRITLTFDSKTEQINNIVKEIQKLIDEHKETNDEGLARFEGFSENGMVFRIEYFIDTREWTYYLKIREEINLKIMEIIYKNNCRFAHTSREVYLHK
ncbi:MAG: mechanosensitive ion channel family protein [Bacteroidales bacterium]|nr:mechanosensitive ion channel family protein [Bacteroidales bacterium]